MCKVSRLHSLFLCTLCGESLILHAVWLQASVGRFNPPISPPLDWKLTGCLSGSRHSWSSWIFRLQDLMQLLYQVSCKACCYSKLLVVQFFVLFFAQNWNFVRLNKMCLFQVQWAVGWLSTRRNLPNSWSTFPDVTVNVANWENSITELQLIDKPDYVVLLWLETWIKSDTRTCCGVSFFVNTCLRICLLWNSHWLFISKDIETCQNGLKVGGESNVVEEILCA